MTQGHVLKCVYIGKKHMHAGNIIVYYIYILYTYIYIYTIYKIYIYIQIHIYNVYIYMCVCYVCIHVYRNRCQKGLENKCTHTQHIHP